MNHSNISLPVSSEVLSQVGIDISILGRPSDGSHNPGAPPGVEPTGDPWYLTRLRNLQLLRPNLVYLSCDHSGQIYCLGFPNNLSRRYIRIDELDNNQTTALPGDAIAINLANLPRYWRGRLAAILRTWDCGNLMIYSWLTQILALVHVSVKTGYGYGYQNGKFPGPILEAVLELCGDPDHLHIVGGPMITGAATPHQDADRPCPYEFDQPDAEELKRLYTVVHPSIKADKFFRHPTDRPNKVDIDFSGMIINSLGVDPTQLDTSVMFCTMHSCKHGQPAYYCNRQTRLNKVDHNLSVEERSYWQQRDIERNGNLMVVQV